MNVRAKNGVKKKAVNLSVDSRLLQEARDNGVNLSAVLERALAEERARRWLEENRPAIELYNRRIEEGGVWSDGLRNW
jgi:antitoxin CcdA